MDNIKVVIDAGHGGTDPGAVANGVKEKDLTLQISQYMLEKFRNAGIPATLIRTNDETLSPTERVKRILEAYGDNSNVIVISNHINSTENPNSTEGAEVIYALRNPDTLANNILDELAKEGQIRRTAYQRRLPDDSTKDYYFIHRNTGTTQPVIIEYGFINNQKDLQRIQNNYKKYVDAVVTAVTKTFNIGSNNSNNIIKYTVQYGDTLWNISRRYNTSVENLMQINNLSSDFIVVGQSLLVPTSGVYIVKYGDSLWNIARKYNTTVENLMQTNNLNSDFLVPGQPLLIPNNNTYVVQYGDSLWSIAKKYNTTIDNLIQINNLNSDYIIPGQLLKTYNI